jgi:two-component system, OmpR family, response regulator
MSAMQQLPHILLVEDDRSIAGALAQVLRAEYEIDIAATGQLALIKSERMAYDVIVLDLSLPDLSGMIVCQQLRDRGLRAPILILSGEDKVLTKISLLDAGANDYLTKPFSLGELKARLRALSRVTSQMEMLQPSGALIIGDLQLDRQSRSVSRNGTTIPLRRKEFALLECLMAHAGSVVSRETLKRYVWQGADDLWTNTVDVHIKHLRDKIDRPFGATLIKTVHGLGYKLEALQPASIPQD